MENLTVQQVTLIVVGVLVAIAFITAIISLLLETDRSRQWYGDWFQGISTEMIGAAVTTIFFTFIVGAVQDQQAQAELRQQLLIQLGSSVNSEAVRAAEELTQRGWLRDGTLQGADLGFADLTGARLFFGDFQNAIFFSAVLENADLNEANFQGAIMQGANLSGAALQEANLQNVDLEAASLEGADLRRAKLNGSTLLNANLANADLTGAQFDTQTTLPDGSAWTADTDMRRFTDPQYADFWRPAPAQDGTLPWWASGE